MKVYSLTEHELEEIYTDGAHRMILHMVKEGLIDRETGDRLLATKQIIVRKKSVLTVAWKRLFGGTDGDKSKLFVATIDDLRSEEKPPSCDELTDSSHPSNIPRV